MMQQTAETASGAALATTAEAAEFLNIARSTLYDLMSRGSILYVKLGNCRRISWEELDRVAREGTE